MEIISNSRLMLLHPDPRVRQAALSAYADAVNSTPSNIHPYVDETVRSFDESDRLYELGRTLVNPDGKSIKKPMGNTVSNSQAGQSYHNYALALDFNIYDSGKSSWVVDHNWMIVVNCFKAHGFTWGGDWGGFKDNPHLENKCGYNWRDLLIKHNNKEFIDGTDYVKL